VDQPVQRVCPQCARISFESGARCPYCGSSFRRRGLLGIAVLLALCAAVILGGTALLLVAAGNEFDRRINREVDRVHQQFESDFDTIQQDVRDELDRRLPEPTPR
jgi:ribosomal protein L37AE/L43A